MSQLKNYFILIIIVLTICPSCATAKKAMDQGTTDHGTAQKTTDQVIPQKATDQTSVKKTVLAGKNPLPADENRNDFQPVLAITPREVDVGTISPGEVVTGVFTFKNRGSGVLDWSTGGPEGWRKLENQKLSRIQEDDADSLRFEIRLPVNGDQLKSYKFKTSLFNTEIQLKNGRG